MPFENAAFLLTRVVSKPKNGMVCFDLGHKAVASEMPHPRVQLLGLENAEYVGHSEEHLVAKVQNWESIQVGDVYLGIPAHICPTMALYDHVNVVEGDAVTGQWNNAARNRL
jgi:D-serine deaminase-like pyridoxal phosphate-dependent protein